nr:retrovirus-related Pol polyprotein from transposon TNT 1-94 [Tanacetum cinerariifolium]
MLQLLYLFITPYLITRKAQRLQSLQDLLKDQGHFSDRNNGGIPGLLGRDVTSKIQFCEACVKEKQRRVKFSTGQHTSKEILEYVHSDLWGPSLVKSQGGCVYFVTFINDFSRKGWVYFLKTKDEVFGKFKEWKNMVEKRTGTKDCGTDQKVEFDTPDRVMIEEEQQEKNNTDKPEQPEQSEPQVEPVKEEADNTSTRVEDSITVRKGKRNAPRPARYAGCVNTYDIDSVAYALAVGDDIRKETTKRDTKEPLAIREIPSQDEDCCLNSDYGGDLVKRRSLTCFIFTLFGCAVSWKSTLQPTVALSTTEAEYTSMTKAKNMAVINDLKALLKSKFEMKDLGTAKKILGMEIWRDRKIRRLWVSQEKYIEKVLQAFFVNQSKPVSTPLAAHFKLDQSTIPGTDKEVNT